MSDSYEMTIYVRLEPSDNAKAVVHAIKHEWNVDEEWVDRDRHENTITVGCMGEDRLFGTESEEEFAERVAKAIWRAVGGFRTVEVDAVFLDEPPPTRRYTVDKNVFMKEHPSLPVPA